ncbi:MAG: bifunctional 4-hydroxy-3-methylbut-2-enyl diphosphate reductase/30S ribosomal protein S1 [Ruminococcaceae bacterium]|nr:bifunctional 4-hydroxy-3-methylbut-2-enyl diphosphate reductase/30S ribosomal protein S1 [Oscillospiraceae bacterium]
MEIIVAKSAGFCFGVERAVNTVRDILDREPEKTKIYSLGNLIHNPHIINEFSSKGVKVIEASDIRNIYENSNEENRSIIVIRTHGISKELNDEINAYSEKNKYFSVIDCTCPYVKKIHKIVSECYDKDPEGTLIIIGDSNHPEVKGIRSYFGGNVIIENDANALSSFESKDKSVFMVAQTTQSLEEWKKCQNFIKKVCTNPFIFDTICSVTENRQNETAKLAESVDVMLVIGGKESSNTAKLYSIAKEKLGESYFIENADKLPTLAERHNIKVGITAGASTPGSIIQEVIKNMSELENKALEVEESFADMLEKSFKSLYTGATVTGVITSISGTEIHVDLQAKVTGIIPTSELSEDPDFDVNAAFKVGDEIQAIVTKVSDLDGVATLSRKKIESANAWSAIAAASAEGNVLEGKVVNAVKGGVLVLANSFKVFVPASQSGLPKDADLATLVGQDVKFKIIDINEQKRRAVGSVRKVAQEERKAKEAAVWEGLEVGKKYEGTVTSLTSYGAFVDIGGVDGLVHSSELSWKRIKHPSEVVAIGDVITVFVKEFDAEKKRISLGYKTEESDPWNIFKSKYNVGDIANVKIVSMMPFGAFAEVVPGADGLIHISQIADKKIAHPSDVLTAGETVDAKITEIDDEKRKISLSIRALLAEEVTEEAVEEAAEVAEEE